MKLPRKRKVTGILLVVSAFFLPTLLLAQYIVDVQVVDLQVSVFDSHGDFITELKPEDFQVSEGGVSQEILDLELNREPFSIGVLLDTSSSMQPRFQLAARGAEDFLYSLRPEDEFFLMTFADRVLLKKDFGLAQQRTTLKLDEMRYGESTRLYDAVISALERLRNSRYPRRALFVISDGLNTSGSGNLSTAVELAQKYKVIIYGLIFDSEEPGLNAVRMLADETGGSYFILYNDFPRLQAAYDKIASDLAHRFTLYYRSRSDYTKAHKPQIKLQMKNSAWHVRFQKTYYPQNGASAQ